ncbi:MAG: heavy metal translocating P-type ATPase [Anaerolineae bacterium]|nr:heavy metal translocating P-type ATPase [Anaerolineae bacterium]
MTTANTAVAGYTNGATVADATAAGEQSQFYKSAVRFTRLYAMFSPTMVALLLAKKTRYGRFIPLPDALPDGFKLGKWSFNGTSAADGDQTEAGAAGAAKVNTAAGKPVHVNGSAPKSATAAHVASRPGVNRSAKAGAPRRVKVRAVEYEVVHHVAGRVRIRIPRLAHDDRFGQRLVSETMELPGVTRARVSQSSRSLVVEYRSQLNGINDAILPQVVECIRSAAEADITQSVASTSEPGRAPTTALAPAVEPVLARRINVVGRMTFPVLGLGMSAGLLAGLALPVWLVGGTVLVATVPTFRRMVQGIRDEKRLTVEVLDATTVVLLVSQASFLAPAFITAVIEGSELARDWTARSSRRATMELMLSMEHKATVERAGEQRQRSWDEIEVGDVLLLYPGDQIPVDGLVLEGKALVDQHRNTGDSLPVLRETGDTVHAASLLLDGHLRIEAQRTGHETQAGQAVALLNTAPDVDTRVSNYGRKVGNWAVVPTLLVGGAVYASSGSIARTTGIVSMDLGTGMRVSAPIAVLVAQKQAARRGILIRSGRALEKLAGVNVVIFDKTATLTSGRATVLHVQPLDGVLDAHDVLALASSAEQSMNHPIGEAIVRFAQGQDIAQRPVTSWDYVAGLGVEAEIDGHVVRVGNSQLMLHGGIDVSVMPANGLDPHLATATRVYVSRDDQLAGAIYCADPLRPESAEVIDSLQATGHEAMVLSGDSPRVTAALAARLGLDGELVYGGLLPQDKAAAVESLQASGRTVAVVGDGVNDAAAMMQADVSIALGCASDLARETADIVLVNDDLRDLLAAIEIARHAMQVIQQNKAMVVIPNLGGITYAALTVMNPATGVIINNGSALAAALNSLRPFRGTGSTDSVKQ